MAIKLAGYSLKAAQEAESGNTLICPLDGGGNAIISILKAHELKPELYHLNFFFQRHVSMFSTHGR